jgi:hypothetical protein
VYSYVAYGLVIRSALRLPELVADGDGAADVVLRFGKVDRLPSELSAEGDGLWATSGEVCRVLEGVGVFLVRDGREIVVDPAPDAQERVLRLSILGPMLALLLHQRGQFVLHASGVEGPDGAVLFAGGSGAGKSTLAATLHARGYSVVTDDVTAIVVSAEGCRVIPGFPQLKLWPDAVISLGKAPETMPRLHPHLEKRAHQVLEGFSHEPLPLRRIYALAEGSVACIESLSPQEALIELVRHSYGSRFGDRLLGLDGAGTAHLHQCATLANRVPIRRLRRPARVRTVLDLADLVEDDLAQDCLAQETTKVPA